MTHDAELVTAACILRLAADEAGDSAWAAAALRVVECARYGLPLWAGNSEIREAHATDFRRVHGVPVPRSMRVVQRRVERMWRKMGARL